MARGMLPGVLLVAVAAVGVAVWRSMPAPGRAPGGDAASTGQAVAGSLIPGLAARPAGGGPAAGGAAPAAGLAIREVEVRRGDERWLFRRGPDGQWTMASSAAAGEPGARDPVIASKVEGLLEVLATLRRLDRFEVPDDRLVDYGLAPPPFEMTLRGESEVVLQVGDRNPAETGVYVRFPPAAEVVLTGALLVWELGKLAAVPTGYPPVQATPDLSR